MSEQELARIRRRWEEYSPTQTSAYRAFMFEAHKDVGRLLEEVDRLLALEGERERSGQVGEGKGDRA